jgi:hypothetical protein
VDKLEEIVFVHSPAQFRAARNSTGIAGGMESTQGNPLTVEGAEPGPASSGGWACL